MSAPATGGLLASLLEAAQDPLRHARLHARAGGRVIGIVGAEVPMELPLAAGAMPSLLPASADEPTPTADRYLEPSFMPPLRSIAEQWLTGRLDFMDAVVFSRGDDSAQRCYYYLCELQRCGLASGPKPLVFDIAKIRRASSLAHTVSAAQGLLHALSGDAAQIPAAIALRDRRRGLLARLDRQRRSPCPPSGSDCARLLRLADLMPADRFDRELTTWLEGAFPRHAGPRVLVTGTTPPDERLHVAVEQAGGCVVAELDDQGLDRLGGVIGTCSQPLTVLAHHYHALECGPRSCGDRTERLVRRALDCAADCVISWLIEEDEAAAWQLPAMTAALARHRIPLLSLTRRSWDARDGSAEEIVEFTRNLSPHA